MSDPTQPITPLPPTEPGPPADTARPPRPARRLLRRLGGGTLVVVGYLLSPLCWWNDLVINLPLALGFGYLVSRPFPEALVPLTGVGYWLSNVVGFVLMQQGAVTALQTEAAQSSQSLRNGLITSTVYTLAVVVLIQCHILDLPDFLRGDLLANLNGLLPDWLMAWVTA
ncbi:MAG: hypothetical protein EA368_00740 [Leptolyngbya sp. DLM2.Bin27]|nr:MAG: hypothetical protein EA368_00740 [Leptolyngbya sp. DLM2.Bin27]